MRSFIGAVQFCGVLVCGAFFVGGIGAIANGWWYLGLPVMFCAVWAAIAIMDTI